MTTYPVQISGEGGEAKGARAHTPSPEFDPRGRTEAAMTDSARGSVESVIDAAESNQLDHGLGRDLAGVVPSSSVAPFDPTFVEVSDEEVDEWLFSRCADRWGPGRWVKEAG